MKHSSLMDFLTGSLPPRLFSDEIAADLYAVEHGFKTKGNSHLNISDGPTEVLTRDHALVLLNALCFGDLSFCAANYVADCCIMSDDFEFADEAVISAMAFLSDESRQPGKDEIAAIITMLGTTCGRLPELR